MVSGKIDDHITVEFEPGIQPDTEFNFANFRQSPDQRLVTVKRIKPVIDIAVFMVIGESFLATAIQIDINK